MPALTRRFGTVLPARGAFDGTLPAGPVKKWWWTVGLLALFAISLFLMHGIHLTYMYPDEYLVYYFTRNDLGYSITYLAEHDVQGPLWFAIFWGWRQVAGINEFTGRVLALLFSQLTLAVLYQTGRQWFGTARAGIFAMLALAGMSLFFQFALAIRPYALALLLASVSMFCFFRWLKVEKLRWGIGYAVTVAAMLYVHYFLFLLILIQALVFAAVFIRRPSSRMFRQAMGLIVVAVVLWLPWLPSFLYQVKNLRDVELIGGNARGAVGIGTTTVATSWDAVSGLIQFATNGQVLLYGIVLLAGAVLLWRRAAYRLALMWALGLPVAAFLINMVVAVYTPRYILTFILGLALALGGALAALPARVRWLALVGFVAISLWGLPSQLPKDRIPYRDIVATLAASAQAGDALFYDRANTNDDIWKWESVRQLPAEFRANVAKTVEEANTFRRVWFITADWLNPEVQANFHAIEATHPLQQVIGDCHRYWCFLIQQLEGSPLKTPHRFGDQMAFWGADVEPVGREAVQVRLWWRVEQTPSINYSIGLQLIDRSGKLVAQDDGAIRLDSQTRIETSQLEPNKIYLNHRSLALPPAVAAGDYSLYLVVYDWQSGERLPVDADASTDSLLLQVVHLP